MLAIVFLFGLQVITDFVAVIYALNLNAFSLGDGEMLELYLASPELAEEKIMKQVIGNSLTSLFLVAPVLLFIFRRRFPSILHPAAGWLLIICRVVEPVLSPGVRMLVAGIGSASFLIFIPTMFQSQIGVGKEWINFEAGLALVMAWMTLVLFRSAGSGIDISYTTAAQPFIWLLGAIAAYLLWRLFRTTQVMSTEVNTGPDGTVAAKTGRSIGLCIGIVAVLVFLYFTLISQSVLARWTETDPLLITVVLCAALAAFVLVLVVKPELAYRMPKTLLIALNIVLLALLFLIAGLNKTAFPEEPGAYPFVALTTTIVHRIPLILFLLLSPILLVDFILLVRELIASKPPARILTTGFTVSGLYFLVVVFAMIFTIIWDYIPGIGPLLKDHVDVVLLIAGLFFAAPLLLLRRKELEIPVCTQKAAVLVFAGLVCLASIAASTVVRDRPEIPQVAKDTITVLTYNIQAGYDDSGSWNYDGQLAVIEECKPDIIGLQESDTCRIAGGNNDIVQYLAARLDCYSYFGPKTVTGTFGVALLSRYPIENPETYYLNSNGEQIAAIRAQIDIGGIAYTVVVTHLGNFGPLQELEDLLEIIDDRRNVILMGDMNFDSASVQYALATAKLNDSLTIARNTPNNQERYAGSVDHIFVSPGIEVEDYRQTGGSNSDHPAVSIALRNTGLQQ